MMLHNNDRMCSEIITSLICGTNVPNIQCHSTDQPKIKGECSRFLSSNLLQIQCSLHIWHTWVTRNENLGGTGGWLEENEGHLQSFGWHQVEDFLDNIYPLRLTRRNRLLVQWDFLAIVSLHWKYGLCVFDTHQISLFLWFYVPWCDIYSVQIMKSQANSNQCLSFLDHAGRLEGCQPPGSNPQRQCDSNKLACQRKRAVFVLMDIIADYMAFVSHKRIKGRIKAS